MNALILLLFVNISIAQSEIVIGSGSLGTGNFVIGSSINEIKVNGVAIIKAIPKPKGRPTKYKKSEAQRLKEALRKLTLKIK